LQEAQEIEVWKLGSAGVCVKRFDSASCSTSGRFLDISEYMIILILRILDRGYLSLFRTSTSQPMSSVSELLAIAKHKLENGIQDVKHSSTTLASQKRCSKPTHNRIASKPDPQ